MQKKRKLIIALTSILVVQALLVGISGAYLGDYYKSDDEAIGAFLPHHTSWKEEPDSTIVFEPENPVAGFIFYPGGCHAYFGMYGAQDGDGTLAITNEEQIRLTAEYISELMF